MQKITLKVACLLMISILINNKLLSQQKEAVTQPRTSKSAEYPNGQAAMYNFIQNNLKYPKDGATCIQGNVYLNFCIEVDGSITNIKVLKGLCTDCDKEAIRVISIMPKWKPALEYGTNKPVKSYYTMPCRFRLE
jgi:outer membrane biosynthesis protein TonB